MTLLDFALEAATLPAPALRFGIRRLVRQRLAAEAAGAPAGPEARLARFLARTRRQRIAEHPELANAQHYEVPSAFFERVLGPRLKYSCCFFESERTALAAAEEAMLASTAARADLADGQRILDLGCGWGSLALWAAERFPRARIVAVSNSATQGAFLRERARAAGLTNVTHLKADVNDWEPAERFDRIVSVEMLEHVRNHATLFGRLRRGLEPDGLLFVHVFAHRELAYPFENESRGDWIARHFFTGGVMPAADLLPALAQGSFAEVERWWVDGTHYARTAERWRARLEQNREELVEVLGADRGRSAGERAWRRWRIFFLACAELFAFRGGSEWGVVHHRFAPNPR